MGLVTGELSLTVMRDRPEADWQVQSWEWIGGPVALLTGWQARESTELQYLPVPGDQLQLGPYRCFVLEAANWLDAVWLGRQDRTGDRLGIAVWRALQAAGEWNARVLRQLARWGLAVPEEAASRTWLDVRPLWDLRQALRRIRAWQAGRRRPAGPQPPEHVNCRCVVVELDGVDVGPEIQRVSVALGAMGDAIAGAGQAAAGATAAVDDLRQAALEQVARDAAEAAGITYEHALERIRAGIERPPLGPPFVAGPDGEFEMPELRAEIRKDGE